MRTGRNAQELDKNFKRFKLEHNPLVVVVGGTQTSFSIKKVMIKVMTLNVPRVGLNLSKILPFMLSVKTSQGSTALVSKKEASFIFETR